MSNYLNYETDKLHVEEGLFKEKKKNTKESDIQKTPKNEFFFQ